MKNIIILIFTSALHLSANAQLGGLLKDLRKIGEQIQALPSVTQENSSSASQDKGSELKGIGPSVQSGNTEPPTTAAATSTPSNAQKPRTLTLGGRSYPLINSVEFCEKLTNSKELAEFANFAKRTAKEFKGKYDFDTGDRLLLRWASEMDPLTAIRRDNGATRLNFHETEKIANNYIKSIERAANECALKLADSDLLYLFRRSEDEFNNLNSNIKRYNSSRTPRTVREIGPNGSLVERTVTPNSSVDFREISYSSRDELISLLPTLVVAWDSNGEVLKNAYPEIKNRYMQAFARVEANQAAKIAQDQVERKANLEAKLKEEESRAKEKEARAKEEEIQKLAREKFAAFAESPDGKLTLTYQYYQALTVCHDVRKGYAAVIINSQEFSVMTDKVKKIESLLKSQLKEKNTDKLWSSASSRNRQFDPLEGSGLPSIKLDIIDIIQRNGRGTGSFQAAKSDCDLMRNRFESISDSVLGKGVVEKKF